MTFYPNRKVFISYYHGDQTAVNKFVQDFSDVFDPKYFVRTGKTL